MLKTLLRVAQCDLNNPFSWISPDIIKLFYGPHDTFISSVSALYPVLGAGGGIPVLYAVFFSMLLQCSFPAAGHSTKRCGGMDVTRPYTHTKNMKCRVILSCGEEENLKPNNVAIILGTQPEA